MIAPRTEVCYSTTMKHFTPFSDNIVFYDSEFSSLDIHTGELLSVGMVKYTGEELYLEIAYDGPVSEWVKEHIGDLLVSKNKVSRHEAKKRIRAFLGDAKPYLVALFNQFDMACWHKLFAGEYDTEPNYWVPIDFASILFACGINPEKGIDPHERELFYKRIGINTKNYNRHNALDDARLLRDLYMVLRKKHPNFMKLFKKNA